MTQATFYIDGFNLYYRAIKHRYKSGGPKLHWLDLRKLCGILFPKGEIQAIKYYTADVSEKAGDRHKPLRQQMYLRALRTFPEIEIHKGQFQTHTKEMPLANSGSDPPPRVDVIKTEEKGSDVNLATHLVHDAHLQRFDVACIISADSDLLAPIKIVRYELGLPVWVFSPQNPATKVLQKHATEYRTIRPGALKKSQLPEVMYDGHGEFWRPEKWREQPAGFQ